MQRILLITQDEATLSPFLDTLAGEGMDASVCPPAAEALQSRVGERPDVIVVDFAALGENPGFQQLLPELQATEAALIALLTPEQVARLDPATGLDDFLLHSATAAELAARVRLALWKKARIDTKNLLKRGDLVMDLANYKVYMSGRPVELTYKEYELLRFLATNADRVFSRETLLSKVWGYDFYGGARTVDVHVRRLRAKIEDGQHTFIETVRNVGYRFRAS
ncbi:MAG: response regulator transcription factor [Chloroflexi bacterium]|nr:response regulator transcription factor [Chloroflexota bacterium]